MTLFISNSANSINWATITDICSDYFTELSVKAGDRIATEKKLFELGKNVNFDPESIDNVYLKELIAQGRKAEYELAKMYHYLNCSIHLNADNHLFHK